MLLDELARIGAFVLDNFLKMWPYLLISIPFAVLIRATNASQYIRRAFVAQPLVAIVLATLVGAFSPFCSCGVIPVITSLLIAGVPLAPVMAFWIASPTMDPEIFFLSVGTLGPNLAVARLIGTLLMSVSAGLLTHVLTQRQFFKEGILREQKWNMNWSFRRLVSGAIRQLRGQTVQLQPAVQAASGAAFVSLNAIPVAAATSAAGASAAGCGCGTSAPIAVVEPAPAPAACGCGSSQPVTVAEPVAAAACGCGSSQPVSANVTASNCDSNCAQPTATPAPKWRQVGQDAVDVTQMVVKFMLITFVLEALITFYVPQEAIINLLGSGNPLSILLAALIGVPVYTSNLTALPLMSGLMAQGMLPGAALAFLISGPATTIPAMSAVYGIAKPRVFVVYLSLILVSAIVLGYAYQWLLGLGII